MKKIIAFLFGLSVLFVPTLPVDAAFCRTTAQHQVCLIDIKRSAKNYWEYRASVKIDGKERPIEVYNCRERMRIQSDGVAVPFVAGGAGDVICSLFKR